VAAEEGVNEGYRGSSYPHGVVASHYLAQQPPNAREGETWMDFLADPNVSRSRNTTNSIHPETSAQPTSSRYNLPNRPPRTDSSSSLSSDRKRRLTTSDSPMRRPSSIRMHSSNPGASTSDPIVLNSSPVPASSPLPPSPAPQINNDARRRGSEIVLPSWQPDAEVSQCPVCRRSFTFLYRKHHCRKCGRVVCASCSPHRITIPRQFIVHPPTESLSNFVDLTGNDDENNMSPYGPLRNPALGGGEEVRVCNPCVPDPNYGPPPQYTPSVPSRRPSQASSHHFAPRPPTHPRAHRSSSSAHDASRTVGHGQTSRPQESAGDTRRVSYHGGQAGGERWLPPLPSSHTQPSAFHTSRSTSSTSRYATANNGHLPFNLGPGSQSGLNMYPRSAFTPYPQPPRRREIAEEDECPVCGNELPPKGLNGDETVREHHIQECLALATHSASPAPAPLASASLPIQRTRGMSSAAEASTSSSRMAHAARGMFTFTATEKDCVDAEGEEEECIICFEEYEAGDKMARLVCLCKFHEVSFHVSVLRCWERMVVANLSNRNASGSGGGRRGGARVRRISYMSRGNGDGDGRLGKAFCLALAYTPSFTFTNGIYTTSLESMGSLQHHISLPLLLPFLAPHCRNEEPARDENDGKNVDCTPVPGIILAAGWRLVGTKINSSPRLTNFRMFSLPFRRRVSIARDYSIE
jgi:hypothetical protein